MSNSEAYIAAGALFLLALYLRFLWQKKLEEEMKEVGVEVKAKIERRTGVRFVQTLYISFELYGEEIKKKIRCAYSEDFLNDEYPMLINPQNHNRFVFNMKKSDLIPSTNDSVQNFLKDKE